MSEKRLEDLQALLDRFGRDGEPPREADLPPGEAAWLPELRGVAAGLDAPDEESEGHYDLPTLRALALERRAAAGEWAMPAHLSACPLCLEAFELLLGEIPNPRKTAIRRYFGEARKTPAPYGESPAVLPLRERVVAAVAAAAILIATVLAVGHLRREASPVSAAATPAVRVERGALAGTDGRLLEAGERLAAGELFEARAATSAVFPDGSEIALDTGSRVSFAIDGAGATTVALEDGGLLATVTKRTEEAPFRVETELGAVQVVGTAFRVDCERAKKTAAQRRSELATGRPVTPAMETVCVTVREGVVRVSLPDGIEETVRAGQSARCRRDAKAVEVTGSATAPDGGAAPDGDASREASAP